jgi:SAM-dependent methyltransferase
MIYWITNQVLDEIAAVVVGDVVGFPYTPQMDVKALIWLAKQTRGNILEVGCNEGYTTYYLARALPDRIVHGVDSTKLLRIHPEQRHEVPGFVGRRARHLPNVRIFEEDFASFDLNCVENVGFVFIDADHTYEGVKRDTEKVFRFLNGRIDAMVAWHDFASSEEESNHPEWLRVGKYVRDELSDRLDVYRVGGTTVAYASAQWCPPQDA